MERVRGLLSGFADMRGVIAENREDLHLLFDTLLDLTNGADERIAESWEKKAKKSGTFHDLMQFPGRDAA